MAHQAIESSEKIGSILGRVLSHGHRGPACVVAGHWQDARESFDLALELGRTHQAARFLDAHFLAGLADAHMGLGDGTRATRALERTGRVVVPTGEEWAVSGTVQSRIWDEHPSQRTKDLQNDLLLVSGARRIGAVVVTENGRDLDLIRRYLPHAARSLDELTRDLTV